MVFDFFEKRGGVSKEWAGLGFEFGYEVLSYCIRFL